MDKPIQDQRFKGIKNYLVNKSFLKFSNKDLCVEAKKILARKKTNDIFSNYLCSLM